MDFEARKHESGTGMDAEANEIEYSFHKREYNLIHSGDFSTHQQCDTQVELFWMRVVSRIIWDTLADWVRECDCLQQSRRHWLTSSIVISKLAWCPKLNGGQLYDSLKVTAFPHECSNIVYSFNYAQALEPVLFTYTDVAVTALLFCSEWYWLNYQ